MLKQTNGQKVTDQLLERLKLISLLLSLDSFKKKKQKKEPTHLENSSSCNDPIFTTQSNMVLESGVDHSLHQNCHHQIILVKFNLKVYYPPPYERAIFHYSQTNDDHIQQSINLFDSENASLNLMLIL